VITEVLRFGAQHLAAKADAFVRFIPPLWRDKTWGLSPQSGEAP